MTTIPRERILTPTDNGNGYLIVSLKRHGTRKNKYIHRLVAEAFLYKPNGMNYVNHKDYNKKNNDVENLEWCTQKVNIRHSSQNMRKPHNSKPGKSGERYIYCNKKGYAVNVHGKYIGTFEFLGEAIKARNKFLKDSKG